MLKAHGSTKCMILRALGIVHSMTNLMKNELAAFLGSFPSQISKFKCFQEQSNTIPRWINKLSNVYTIKK